MVAAGGRLQGARSLEDTMELIEFTRTCASLQLRGIAVERADPMVRPRQAHMHSLKLISDGQQGFSGHQTLWPRTSCPWLMPWTVAGSCQELESWLADLRAAGAEIGTVSMPAGSQALQPGPSLAEGTTTIVRVGAALYGQQALMPGTVPAARWLTRIASIRRVRRHTIGEHCIVCCFQPSSWMRGQPSHIVQLEQR